MLVEQSNIKKYRATRDGFGSQDFHSMCDRHRNTLTLYLVALPRSIGILKVVLKQIELHSYLV